jgi:hypothetical protein
MDVEAASTTIKRAEFSPPRHVRYMHLMPSCLDRKSRSLKLHALHLLARRRRAIGKVGRGEVFAFAGTDQDRICAAQERMLAALMAENSRLVDQLRAAMREAQANDRQTGT